MEASNRLATGANDLIGNKQQAAALMATPARHDQRLMLRRCNSWCWEWG
ncbi:hypothetical protein VRRI112168_12555 [Vreelandella rituensis]|nr:hypothetical protein [Halomonas rituensis]